MARRNVTNDVDTNIENQETVETVEQEGSEDQEKAERQEEQTTESAPVLSFGLADRVIGASEKPTIVLREGISQEIVDLGVRIRDALKPGDTLHINPSGWSDDVLKAFVSQVRYVLKFFDVPSKVTIGVYGGREDVGIMKRKVRQPRTNAQ